MKNLIASAFFVLVSVSAFGKEPQLEKFAEEYFATFIATQQDDATKADLETYLDFMTDDVGHTHSPFFSDEKRYKDGKDRLRQAMLPYLKKNTGFKAELIEIRIFNETAIALRYSHSAVYVDVEKGTKSPWSYVMMEILEIENGKVGMIRKYHE
ncbi:nuclear transport factor 2 family protein [Teredinibacter franksiae]|uniref:nuclear transport factor 2 family protein n=1 Tax=Teredinibacter franksiae TaxID=2761453 RepID=UPI0016250188|nr:nuclear transport factor 2 family protein [Teredinibacter franksiae]